MNFTLYFPNQLADNPSEPAKGRGLMAGKARTSNGNFDVLGVVKPLLKEPKKPNEKTARTMMLNHEKFEAFQEACRVRGAKPSVLIDQWIEAFLTQIKDQKAK